MSQDTMTFIMVCGIEYNRLIVGRQDTYAVV